LIASLAKRGNAKRAVLLASTSGWSPTKHPAFPYAIWTLALALALILLVPPYRALLNARHQTTAAANAL
jgi:hypothetical protein